MTEFERLRKLQLLRDSISEMLRGFVDDPPDNDFQRGYLEALQEVARISGVPTPKGAA